MTSHLPYIQYRLVDDVGVCLFAEEYERLVLQLVKLLLDAPRDGICNGEQRRESGTYKT